MNVTFNSTCKIDGRTVEDCTPVNPGHFPDRGFLVNAGLGNFFSNFLVEAKDVNDAIEEFAASKYGHLIIVDESYIDEAKLEGYIGDYVLTDSGYVDLQYRFNIEECCSFFYTIVPENFKINI